MNFKNLQFIFLTLTFILFWFEGFSQEKNNAFVNQFSELSYDEQNALCWFNIEDKVVLYI